MARARAGHEAAHLWPWILQGTTSNNTTQTPGRTPLENKEYLQQSRVFVMFKSVNSL